MTDNFCYRSQRTRIQGKRAQASTAPQSRIKYGARNFEDSHSGSSRRGSLLPRPVFLPRVKLSLLTMFFLQTVCSASNRVSAAVATVYLRPALCEKQFCAVCARATFYAQRRSIAEIIDSYLHDSIGQAGIVIGKSAF